jgi:nickel transport protein
MAHRVNLFAWVEGDTVYVESKFPGGRKVKAGQIVVLDNEDNELLTGATNDEGEFSFKVPKRADLRIVLKAGMGHQAQWTIPAEEILEAAGEAAAEVHEPEPPPAEVAVEPEPEAISSPQVTTGMTEERVQRLIEEALEKKLEPIRRMLAKSQESGPSVTEVVGGIGYIFGLLGVAAYFMSRRKGGGS